MASRKSHKVNRQIVVTASHRRIDVLMCRNQEAEAPAGRRGLRKKAGSRNLAARWSGAMGTRDPAVLLARGVIALSLRSRPSSEKISQLKLKRYGLGSDHRVIDVGLGSAAWLYRRRPTCEDVTLVSTSPGGTIADRTANERPGTNDGRSLAEGAGFEPAIRFPVYTLSRRAPSTTRPPLPPALRRC